ncbi:MAG TPA: hypothetical protein ENI63_01070 [Candidatus Kaiserbacteria bacterium]|nr:hypothetical protein [Candidatus Kaiserbacteria bacterium]
MEQNHKKQTNINEDTSQNTSSIDSAEHSKTEETKIPYKNKEVGTDVTQNKFQSKEKKKVSIKNTIKRIRTYKEDIAEAIRSQKASLTSITAAEQGRTSIPNDVVQKSYTDPKKIAVIIGSILLIVLGISVIIFFTLFYEKKDVVIEKEIPSFFFVEKQKETNITNKSPRKILQKLSAKKEKISLSLGQIANLYITKTTKNVETESTYTVSSKEFLKDIHAQVSDAFLRSLEPSFMVGIHSFNQNQPFIIFKSNSYQNSFRGMLEWENAMYNDLFPFFVKNTDPILKVPINPKTGRKIVLRENFEDKIMQNIDVRALLSVDGDVELLYAFPNQQTLIITTNESTLIELITRLNSVRVF